MRNKEYLKQLENKYKQELAEVTAKYYGDPKVCEFNKLDYERKSLHDELTWLSSNRKQIENGDYEWHRVNDLLNETCQKILDFMEAEV